MEHLRSAHMTNSQLPFSNEKYEEIKNYIKETSSTSLYIIFVLIAEYGFVASDLFQLKKKNIVFTNDKYQAISSDRTVSFPSELNEDLSLLYTNMQNGEDYFFHTMNNRKILATNFSAFLKRISETFAWEELSCKYLSSLNSTRIRIDTSCDTKLPTNLSYMIKEVPSAPYIDFWETFTSTINNLNRTLQEIEITNNLELKERQLQRLTAYFKKFNGDLSSNEKSPQ